MTKIEYRQIDNSYCYISCEGVVFSTYGNKITVLKGHHVNGYHRFNISGQNIKVHRLVAKYFVANPYNYNIVDHIDGDKLNNHYKNLRWCTISQNSQNKKKRPNTSSPYIGVWKFGNGWRFKIFHNGIRDLKFFKSELDAAKMYDKKALEYFGKYAKLNFPH